MDDPREWRLQRCSDREALLWLLHPNGIDQDLMADIWRRENGTWRARDIRTGKTYDGRLRAEAVQRFIAATKEH